MAEHARRIQEADLAYPIILSADGRLMDGGHRLAKAWLRGLFAGRPPPDRNAPKVIDVQYEIVERKDDERH